MEDLKEVLKQKGFIMEEMEMTEENPFEETMDENLEIVPIEEEDDDSLAALGYVLVAGVGVGIGVLAHKFVPQAKKKFSDWTEQRRINKIVKCGGVVPTEVIEIKTEDEDLKKEERRD